MGGICPHTCTTPRIFLLLLFSVCVQGRWAFGLAALVCPYVCIPVRTEDTCSYCWSILALLAVLGVWWKIALQLWPCHMQNGCTAPQNTEMLGLINFLPSKWKMIKVIRKKGRYCSWVSENLGLKDWNGFLESLCCIHPYHWHSFYLVSFQK